MARWMIGAALQRLATLPHTDPLYLAGLARVRDLRAAYETPAAFAAAMGCCERSVYRLLRAYGVEGYQERLSSHLREGRERPAKLPRIARQTPAIPESHRHPPQRWCSCAECLAARGAA